MKFEQADVLSGLFAQQKPPPPDDVVNMHRQIFQKEFAISGQQPSGTLLSTISDKPKVRPPVLDRSKADQLLSKFQIKSSYFPFVAIPSNIASAEHRFLYLAVLTVASSDDMALLRSLDSRFRTVLADRVVNAGEKSLDYLQGLLVYMAWYNMHLRPRSFQLYQYLQIAISMMVDLGFDDDAVSESDTDQSLSFGAIEAKNACLGCYYLSSLMATGSKRQNKVALSDSLKTHILQLSGNVSPRNRMMLNCVQLQMSIESAYKNDEKPDLFWVADSQLTSDCSFSTPSINIARLILSFLEETRMHIREPTLLGSNKRSFQSIMTKARAFLDHFISVPTSEFSNFSHAEWERLITVIRVLTRTLSAAAGLPGIVVVAEEESRRLTKYLERLANRMGELSRSGRNPGEFPDMFFLFKSVLNLICPLPLATHCYQDPCLAQDSEPQPRTYRCPVLTGLEETNFWDAYQTSLPADDLGVDFEMLIPNDEHLFALSTEEWMNATECFNYTLE
ncbi:hypothetical protein BBP40_011605 [Aspergillus hancockii]|nr:hypothetical protein BBP40_011605 [Aspergillus hancockii]